MLRRISVLFFAVALLVVMTAASAFADAGNERITMQFNKPVELPGHVLLPGKYDMSFLSLEHHTVLVTTANGQHPIGFFEVVPVTRRHAGNTKINLAEPVSRKSVPRVSDFFYQGTKTGYEFLYPHSQTRAMAKLGGEASAK